MESYIKIFGILYLVMCAVLVLLIIGFDRVKFKVRLNRWRGKAPWIAAIITGSDIKMLVGSLLDSPPKVELTHGRGSEETGGAYVYDDSPTKKRFLWGAPINIFTRESAMPIDIKENQEQTITEEKEIAHPVETTYCPECGAPMSIDKVKCPTCNKEVTPVTVLKVPVKGKVKSPHASFLRSFGRLCFVRGFEFAKIGLLKQRKDFYLILACLACVVIAIVLSYKNYVVASKALANQKAMMQQIKNINITVYKPPLPKP